MNYDFPIILNIEDVLPAIKGRDEFVVTEKEGYTVINYKVMMSDTFPDVISDVAGFKQNQTGQGLVAWCEDHFNNAVRRECRGIIFDTATGNIIRRPFHKFFNVNEREETQDHVIDLSRPHVILEKLDGSMIAVFAHEGKLIWGTKMGATDVAKPVEEFVKNNPQYEKFALACMKGEPWLPIFEWCSRKQRIVMDYPEDQLILTAMRHLIKGTYASYEQLVNAGGFYNIPVVRAFEPETDMKEFLEYVRDLEDLEGFVVRFDDGHMLKLKCHWYVQIHKAKEAILQDRNIVELILEEHLDDIKAHLPAEDRDQVTQFENNFNCMLLIQTAVIMTRLCDLQTQSVDRKTFALEHSHTVDSFARSIIFKNFDTVPSSEKIGADIRNTIRNNLTKTVKYEAIRDAWFPGVIYNV